ncbi:hypothetical protein SAMN05660337_1796 [Maridesulfovibrio ferrireducens]|uniref:Uncharacterized protein n=1 Tax=Maridesulfovibrio ferrireducens TaxID=246191 RepID=A0A1G9G1M8_9BACT|nr:hypothetical protein [Maridesulfovibrio ferrireducens]SDK94558.1 hypothetical protein SAMN05660337_1796 [Maridesulfovibrio ferrireducens]
MIPSSLIPAINTLAVAPIWLETLLVTTFAIHLLLMNIALGGTVLVACHSLSGGSKISRDLSGKLPTILALVINAGVPPLLFVKAIYAQFNYTSSVLMAVYWLVAVVALLVGYYGLYWHYYRYESMKDGGRKGLIFMVLCILLYVGFMLSNNMTLMLRPDHWLAYFDNPNGLVLNLNDTALMPRYLHFMVSALAIGGLFVAILGKRKSDQDYVATGFKWFVWATVVNIGVGLWFLMVLPREIMLIFMGKDMLATSLLGIGLVGTVALIYAGMKQKVVLSSVLTVIMVYVMVVMRHLLRDAYLAPYFKVEDIPVTGQYSPFYLFLISLVIGIISIIYMLKLMCKSGRS